MVNAKKKGSRVELELVHWLKERGIHSAQRTQQYNGLGKSDVIAPEELPSFHLESKGVKSPLSTRGQLRGWCDQLMTDCPENQFPALFCKPNHHKWFSFIFLTTYPEIAWHRGPHNTFKEILTGDSFNLAEKIVTRMEFAETYIAAEQIAEPKIHPGHYFYRVAPRLFIALMDAEDLLVLMREYEDRIKNGVGDSERGDGDTCSVACRGLAGSAKKYIVGSGVYNTDKSDAASCGTRAENQ